jgi:ABC-type bacteriocin/lantibiotic exporter with double-glycine peptidase domain
VTLLLAALLAATPAATPAATGGVWLDVPYAAGPDRACGSAVAWMVTAYWAQNRGTPDRVPPVEETHERLFRPLKEGVTTGDLEAYFKGLGFRTFAFSATLADVEHHLRRGRPLIVILEPAGPGAPLHYVTIAGIDPGRNLILLNDPAGRKLQKMDLRRFERQWQGTGRWTLLAVPE